MYSLSSEPHPSSSVVFDDAAMKMIAPNGKPFGECNQPDIRLFNAFFEWIDRESPRIFGKRIKITAPPTGDCLPEDVMNFWNWLGLMISKCEEILSLTSGDRYEWVMKMRNVLALRQNISNAIREVNKRGETPPATLVKGERDLADLLEYLKGAIFEDSAIIDDYAIKIFREHKRSKVV